MSVTIQARCKLLRLYFCRIAATLALSVALSIVKVSTITWKFVLETRRCLIIQNLMNLENMYDSFFKLCDIGNKTSLEWS